ncbi:ammonium transporter [Spirochaeta dissipatitropha]
MLESVTHVADAGLIDTLWLLISAALVFFMQAGFSFLESGLTRSKNSINVAIKNLTDLGVSICCYWLFGFALMFGLSRFGLFGLSGFFFASRGSMWMAAFFLFQAMFCSTAATIVSGAVAERMRYVSYIASTVLLAALIYPILGHWVWGGALLDGNEGWLEAMGFIDFAGSTVVHSTGGWIALAALLLIGPRSGRFDGPDGPKAIPGSNIPTAVVGVMILWFGWFGFNGGSTLGLTPDVPQILVNTALAASAGMVGALALGWLIIGRPDVGLVLNGSLAGLVAITAPAPFVAEWQAVIIGLTGGWIMIGADMLLVRLKIDDAVSAIPVHLAAGIWGTLSVALFGDLNLLGSGLSRSEQFNVQLIGILAIGAWAFSLAFILLKIVNRFMPLRVSEEQESSGLNVAEHGVATESHDLVRVMEEHRRSGNLSSRVPVEPFTEVGTIAEQYNAVLDSLNENLVAKSEYINILDNVSDGLFLIDQELFIAPYFSRSFAEIIEENEPGGLSLRAILPKLLPEAKLQSVFEFLDLCFSDTVDHRTVLKLNPLQQEEFFFDSGNGIIRSKHLQWTFTRIRGNADSKVQLMVLLRDVTSTVLLGEQVEQQRRDSAGEMELLYRILHIDPAMLKDFISSAEENIRTVNAILESGNAVMKIDDIFSLVHRIKGDAALLSLDFIAERAHELEDHLADLRKRKHVGNEDFLSVTIAMSRLVKMLNKANGATQRLVSFQHSFADSSAASSGDMLLETLRLTADRTAVDQKKQVELIADIDSSVIPAEMTRGIRDALIQLLRNAVVHGIESPEERTARAKNPRGQISVRVKSDYDRDRSVLCVSVRDDGRGLDFDGIRKQAVLSGVLASSSSDIKPEDAARLLFSGGFSTAASTDMYAGRGVGMGIVGSLVREFNGRISVAHKAGAYTEFTLRFPR